MRARKEYMIFSSSPLLVNLVKNHRQPTDEMRAGTQNGHSVTHQKRRVKRGSKYWEECTESTDQGTQLRSLTTPNQNREGVKKSTDDEIREEMGTKTQNTDTV